MKEFIRIGVDLAKNYFQVHALENEDGRAATRKLSRLAMRKFFAKTRPCLASMEACGPAPLSEAHQMPLMRGEQTKGRGARACGHGAMRCA